MRSDIARNEAVMSAALALGRRLYREDEG